MPTSLTDSGPPVCVLGFGRSGTSLTTRALHLLGVDLGPPERMLGANNWNPAGHWEQEPIIQLNDEILSAFGGSYVQPPEMPDGWHRDDRVADIRRRLIELLRELFSPERRWGFKDPRTVLTLPLWKDVVGDMIYVICVRDPLESAASHRVGWPQLDADHFLGLWLAANAEALRQTTGERRVVVLYDEWFRDPDAVIQRLHRLVRGAPGPPDPIAAAAVRKQIDPDLHRQRAGGFASGHDVPLEIREMLAVLTCLTTEDSEQRAAALPRTGATLDVQWRERRSQASRSRRLIAPLRTVALTPRRAVRVLRRRRSP